MTDPSRFLTRLTAPDARMRSPVSDIYEFDFEEEWHQFANGNDAITSIDDR
jgi:hypothetical protein